MAKKAKSSSCNTVQTEGKGSLKLELLRMDHLYMSMPILPAAMSRVTSGAFNVKNYALNMNPLSHYITEDRAGLRNRIITSLRPTLSVRPAHLII